MTPKKTKKKTRDIIEAVLKKRGMSLTDLAKMASLSAEKEISRQLMAYHMAKKSMDPWPVWIAEAVDDATEGDISKWLLLYPVEGRRKT